MNAVMRRKRWTVVISVVFFGFLFSEVLIFHNAKVPGKKKLEIIRQSWNQDNLSRDTNTNSSKHLQGMLPLGSTDIQIERKTLIRKACQANIGKYTNTKSGYDIRHFLFSDARHDLLYCQVQKAGSSFMWDMMVKLNQSEYDIDKTKTGLYSFPNKMETAHLHAMIMNSFKVMFVREPYGRMFASYVDKLLSANLFYWRFYGKVLKRQLATRFNYGTISKCGHDVTFPQLIFHFIQAEKTTDLMRDNHFTPIYDHCSPCQIRYDFVGKMETFKDDMMTLLDHWNEHFKANINFKNFSKESALGSAQHQIRRLFKEKDKWNECISFYSALRREWRTLQIRGIIPISEELPFSEEDNLTWKQVYNSIVRIYNNVTDFKSLKNQQKEAMIEAYSLIPWKQLEELREIVRPDCQLFGYDPSPEFIFNNKLQNQNRKPKYFDILLDK